MAAGFVTRKVHHHYQVPRQSVAAKGNTKLLTYINDTKVYMLSAKTRSIITGDFFVSARGKLLEMACSIRK
jgi:hypothetical protein